MSFILAWYIYSFIQSSLVFCVLESILRLGKNFGTSFVHLSKFERTLGPKIGYAQWTHCPKNGNGLRKASLASNFPSRTSSLLLVARHRLLCMAMQALKKLGWLCVNTHKNSCFGTQLMVSFAFTSQITLLGWKFILQAQEYYNLSKARTFTFWQSWSMFTPP